MRKYTINDMATKVLEITDCNLKTVANIKNKTLTIRSVQVKNGAGI